MNPLNSELKFLLLSTIAGVPDVALNGNWNELKEDIKQSVYEIVIESVLDKDRQLVAATLLNALRDGSVRRDEWGEIVKTWTEKEAKDNPFVVSLLNDLQDSQLAFRDERLSKDEVLAVLVARAKRQTNNQGVLDFLLRFLKNLQDSKLTSAEIRSVILEWATERVSNNQIVKDLLNALTNGQLSKDKVLAVLIAWVKRQTDNQTILALLDGISSDQFDETAVWKALELYLDNSGLDENLVKAIKSAVGSDMEVVVRQKPCDVRIAYNIN